MALTVYDDHEENDFTATLRSVHSHSACFTLLQTRVRAASRSCFWEEYLPGPFLACKQV